LDVFTLKNHETAGFHFGRTARCRRHHCSVIGNVAAGFDQSEIDRSMRRLPKQSAPTGLATQSYGDDNNGSSFSYYLGTTDNAMFYWFGWINMTRPECQRPFDCPPACCFLI
jgi:hypothetical protein